MTAKFRAGEQLVVISHPELIVRIVKVNAHTYTIEAVNYGAAYKTWLADWDEAEKAFRKLTKLDKALK